MNIQLGFVTLCFGHQKILADRLGKLYNIIKRRTVPCSE